MTTTTIDVEAELRYDVGSDTSFSLAVTAARTPHQRVDDQLVIEPDPGHRLVDYGEDGTHQLVRFTVPAGPLTVRYRATVTLDPASHDPDGLAEVPFDEVPADVLPYLNPSRYCESDQLGEMAGRLFGATAPGFGRVRAVSEWVGETLCYVPGSTGPSTGTQEVLAQQAGVCRDFAHVAISFCRAIGIPARYVAGYGVGVEPPDFHGFFEAYLGGEWWLFDPTGMTSPDTLVRIGYGRDAADAAFATLVGQATLLHKTVVVSQQGIDGGGTAVTASTA